MRKFISKLFRKPKKQPKAKIVPFHSDGQEKQEELVFFLAKMVGYIHEHHNDLLNRLVDDIRSGKINVEQAADTLYETMKKEA